MPETLVIYSSSTTLSNVDWLLLDDQQSLLQSVKQSSQLSELTELAENRTVVFVFPAIECQLNTTAIPSTNTNRLTQAIPFSLEEQTAESIEHLHFAYRSENAQLQLVAVVSKKLMQEMLEQFKQVDIEPDVFIPESLLLPYEDEKQWHLALIDNIAIIRTQNDPVITIDRDNLTLVINTLVENARQQTKPLPDTINVYTFSPTPLTDKNLATIPLVQKKTPKHPLEWYLKQWKVPPTLNLLQGEFLVEHKQTLVKKHWLSAGALASVCLLIFLTGHLTEFFYLSGQHKTLTKNISEMYYTVFPKASSVTSPKIRIQRKLSEIQKQEDDAGFLSLLGQAGPIFKNMGTVQIESMAYEDAQLSMQVTTDNFKKLQLMTQLLKKVQLNVRQTDASSTGKIIRARLIIRSESKS